MGRVKNAPVVPVKLRGDVARRLRELAIKWGVAPEEAARRVLDQAFVGRGAMVALEAAFVFGEHLLTRKPVPKPSLESMLEKQCSLDCLAAKRKAGVVEPTTHLVSCPRFTDPGARG